MPYCHPEVLEGDSYGEYIFLRKSHFDKLSVRSLQFKLLVRF